MLSGSSTDMTPLLTMSFAPGDTPAHRETLQTFSAFRTLRAGVAGVAGISRQSGFAGLAIDTLRAGITRKSGLAGQARLAPGPPYKLQVPGWKTGKISGLRQHPSLDNALSLDPL